MEFQNVISKNLAQQTITTSTASEATDITGCQTLAFSVNADVMTDTTFLSGESEVQTVTFLSQANTDPGDYLILYDTAGLAWAAAADITGSDPEPTGAEWVAIPAGRKTQVDLSGATTAASVAAAFELALDALTNFPFTTDDSAADGTMEVTCTIRGPITDAVSFNEDDSGPGTMTFVVDNAGVASTVDVTDNEVTIASHNYYTGMPVTLTSTGTLPAGVTTSTTYYLIVVDSNTIKFASSLANAQAGTAIDLTNQGSDGATNTVDVAALTGANVKIQGSLGAVDIDAPPSSYVWYDIGSPTTITADANILFTIQNPECRYYRVYYTLATGIFYAEVSILGKGIV